MSAAAATSTFLDRHAQDRRGDGLGLLGRPGELHAAGLAAATDEDLGLDDDLFGAGEHSLCGRARFGNGPRDLPRRDRQALRQQELLRVGFLDLHAAGCDLWRQTGPEW